jgi:hypothetical protein
VIKTRKDRCFERWDERFEEIAAAQRRLSSARRVEALIEEFGIHPKEQKWFVEWMKLRSGHPPMTPAMRRHTSLHEAAHAVLAEIVLPGSVGRAACYREQQPNPNFGKDEHPHGQTGRYLRGATEYDEQTCLEFNERDALEYISRRIVVAQIAEVIEKRFGFENQAGIKGDKAVEDYHIGLAATDAERDTIQRRVSELLTLLSDFPLVEQAVREVADRLFQEEVVTGAEIRTMMAGKLPPLDA